MTEKTVPVDVEDVEAILRIFKTPYYEINYDHLMEIEERLKKLLEVRSQ